jgi:hypothetical protein
VSRRTRTPVPPLGDAAISRIERGLFAALDSERREAARPLDARPEGGRRRGVAFAIAGVAAAVALLGVREAHRGETLPGRAGQISTTTSGSSLAIAGATLEVAPQSAVSFGGRRDGTVVVVLDRGTVTCEVAPRSKRAPFVVEAGATRVTVIGTRFSVRREGEHATVSVEHGLVEVADANMTELVHAGERYRPGEPVVREVGLSQVPAPALVSQAPAPVKPAPVAASAAPEATRRAERPAAPARHRRLALAEVDSSADETAAPTREDATPGPAPSHEAPATPAVAAAAPAEPAAVAPAGAPRRSVQVLFELAAQLEIRDPEAALRIYGELAAAEPPSEGGWAASALFAAARLESERGHAAQAHELCEAYLRRFPRGPNADDARTLLAR